MVTTPTHVDILKLPIVGREGARQVATIPMATIRTAAASLMELEIEFGTDGLFVACRYVVPERLPVARAAGISG